MQNQETETLINNNQVQQPNYDNLSFEQLQKLRKIKKASIIVILSAILRIVIVSIFFEPISFTFSLIISILGIVGAAKKNKPLLLTYGIISLFQVFGAIAALIYFSITTSILNNMPTWVMVFIGTALFVFFVGGLFSIKMRQRISQYEQEHGPVPRCCGRRCNMVCNNEQQTQQTQQTQQFAPIQENSVNSVNTEYVMIPMQSFGEQNQQPVFIAQQPNQQVHQPVFIAQQPNQQTQQPIFIAQQPNQQTQQSNAVPMVYAFPQGAVPTSQVFGQQTPTFVQFVPQQQNNVPQQQNPNYVYRN